MVAVLLLNANDFLAVRFREAKQCAVPVPRYNIIILEYYNIVSCLVVVYNKHARQKLARRK